MRSHRPRSQATRAAAPAQLPLRAALLTSIWLGALAIWRRILHSQPMPPGSLRHHCRGNGPKAPTGARPACPTARRRSQTTAPLHQSLSPTTRRSTPLISVPQRRRIRSPFRMAQTSPSPATSSTIPHSSQPSPSTRARPLTAGDGAFVEIGSLAGGGRVTIGPSDSSSLLSIVGNAATTFSGQFSGAGSLELDNGASLTLTGASFGGNIGTIGGDLTLCGSCSGGATLTISGAAAPPS